MRVSSAPPTAVVLVGYGRYTNCPGEVPGPLPPGEVVAARPPACVTLEVGAKSYADTLGAIGSALVAVLPFFF